MVGYQFTISEARILGDCTMYANGFSNFNISLPTALLR
jgi:hypothetical protein